jgi:acyl CoA:acetate/3-ketoacid CoA transferase alpha subunit
MAEIMSLPEAIATFVHDGDSVCLEGSPTSSRTPPGTR